MTVLTHSNEYYAKYYSRRTTLAGEYLANMELYLQRLYPHLDKDELSKRIKATFRSKYKPTNIKYLHSDSPGDVQSRQGTLLEYTNELNTNIMTPYGSMYRPIKEQRSIFIDYIGDNQSARKKMKHEMLVAEAKGDKDVVRIKNLGQMNTKIKINALSGVMLSNVTFRSSINYNAITSIARHSIMLSYSLVEMLSESNYYLYDEDQAINWIINLLRVYPGDDKLDRCIVKYRLSVPTCDQVKHAYLAYVRMYSKFSMNRNVNRLINTLSNNELTFVYYAMNMCRIFRENDSFHRKFNHVLDITNIKEYHGDVPNVGKLSDSIIANTAIIMIANDIDSKSAEIGEAITLDDIADKHPELARKLYAAYLHIEDLFKALELLFDTFILLPIIPANVSMHKMMMRKTVLLSDTDSIMFTNANWAKWLTGDVKINDKATYTNALITALISKVLEHSLAYMSASMNIDAEYMKKIAIKNEFMYDIFMRTPISKHYAGYVRYREGMRLNPYKFDIKGKNFKGSDLCKTTTAFVNKFIRDIFDDYLTTYELKPYDLLMKIINFEQQIKNSIRDGDVTFLNQVPIRMEHEYKTPLSSQYFYYLLWRDVFADKYGELHLPQKCKEIPITEIGAKRLDLLQSVKIANPEIYTKFVSFLKKYPDKKISRILIPENIVIPEEVRDLANYRKVCSKNCYSLYLILKSFNIVNFPNSSKSIVLFSDIYPELLTRGEV